MGKSDYKMAEFTSNLILKCFKKHKRVPDDLFDNLQKALVHMTLNHIPMGPNVKRLYIHLDAEYSYRDVNELPGFDLGAIYGSIEFYNTFKNLTKKKTK